MILSLDVTDLVPLPYAIVSLEKLLVMRDKVFSMIQATSET